MRHISENRLWEEPVKERDHPNRTGRAWRTGSSVQRLLLLIVSMSGGFCFSQTDVLKPLEDPKAVVNTILLAIQNVNLVPAGRGSATMIADTMWSEGAHEPIMVDFAFKDRMSRIDRFASAGGKKTIRTFASAITEKCKYGINDQYASVTPVYQPLHNGFGRDFHPETFMNLKGATVQSALQQMLDPVREQLSAGVDANGVIHFTSRWQNKNPKNSYAHTFRLAVDPARGCLPVLFASEFDYPGQPTESSRQVTRVNWVRFGSGWYVSSGDYRFYSLAAPDKGEHEQFEITQFDPNAVISDTEFTLQGLGVADGMTVVDQVAGVSYQYGALLRETSELEEPLKQAEFVEKALRQGRGASDSGLNPESAPTARAQEPVPNDRPSLLATPSWWPTRTGAVLGLSLLVIVLFGIGYKRTLKRTPNRGERACR